MGDGAARADSRRPDDALADRLPDEALGHSAAELKRRGLQRPLSYFVHAHVGKPAVVIGGGMSLPAAMQLVPPPGEAIYISANAHGVKRWPCDYIVALDAIEDYLLKFGTPIASPRKHHSTIRLLEQRVNQSGMKGVYLARAFGCSPIFVAGMDLYIGGTYHDAPNADSSGLRVRLDERVNRWKRCAEICAGADVRVVAGPMLEHDIFATHDPRRPPLPPVPARALFAEVGGIVVEFTQSATLKPYVFKPGDVVELAEHERSQIPTRSYNVLGSVKREPELRFRAGPIRLAR